LASDILNFLPGAFNAFLSPYDPKLDEDEDENNEDDPNFLDDDDDDSPF
jgi:hypothetical protein